MTKFVYLITIGTTNKIYCDRSNIQIKPFRKHDEALGKNIINNKFNIGAKVQRLKGNFGIGTIVNYNTIDFKYTLHITHSKYNTSIGQTTIVYAKESEFKLYETF